MPDEISALKSLPSATGRNSRMTTVQQIYTDLRLLIIDLSLTPGTLISKNEIAELYGVSQTPVREALILLEEDGLVDIFPQSRTEVSRIDVQNASEVHFLRLSVEIEVARVLAETIDESGLQKLKTWIARLTTELEADDQPSFRLTDNSFHEEMFRLAGIAGVTRMIERRRGHYDRLRGLFLLEQGRRLNVINEHGEIYKALKNHDKEAAEAAVRAHLGKSLAIVDQIRELHPDFFT